MQFLTRPRAAQYLADRGIETSARALADRASKGSGPRYAIVNGKAVYTAADLDAWLCEQAARSLAPRKRRGLSADASA